MSFQALLTLALILVAMATLVGALWVGYQVTQICGGAGG